MTIPLSAATTIEKDKTESSAILVFVDLYLDGETLHFVSHTVNVDFWDPEGNAATYSALKMLREKKEQSMDMQIQTLTGGLDNVDQALSAQIATKTFVDRRIVIRECFYDLISDADSAWLVFDGYMDKPVITKKKFQIEMVPRLGRGTLTAKLGIRQQLFCPLTFSGSRCAYGTSAAVLKDTRSAQVIDSGAVGYIVDSARVEVDDYWNYGFVVFASDTLTTSLRGVSRMIKDFIAAEDKVVFSIALPASPQAGDTYSIERGCDLTLDSCQNKFANQVNFGGLHTLPDVLIVR